MAFLFTLGFVVPFGAWAQSPSDPEEKTGLKVGAQAPAFRLKAQDGREYTLADLLKKSRVALVFHRSAKW